MPSSVCFLITGLDYGGAEIQVINLAEKLKRKNWTVNVISMTIPNGSLVNRLTLSDIKVASLNMRRGVPDIRAFYKLHRIIKSWNPDIVHSHMFHANLFGRIGRIFCHVPVFISTIHNIYEGNDYEHHHGDQWIYLAYRITNWLCDYTTIISQTAMEHYLQKKAVPRRNFQHVPNGIDVNGFYPDINSHNILKEKYNLKDQFIWLAVGRIEEQKDYPTLLKAFREVANKKPEATLMVVGDGTLKDQMITLTDGENLGKAVRWLGKRENVPELMNMADAYVMSSRWEGMPMVLLEAAASGLPIVATDVGGNREIVVKGKTGYLVSPDNAEQLENAMLSMMTLPPRERHRWGSEGRQYVEAKYGIDKVVEEWINLYCNLFQQRLGK
ncbi:MAG: hypothetical protein BWK78_00790 [Thiotrichaceae bacterium IS1]|nr:MAG: hypothetical protein BWK78_00790 [Thiotrichaceae bacterium IS1]